jgi:hypothetical protein
MAMPTGRSEKRTSIEVDVVLSHLNEKSFRETASTENVSSRGLRTITKRMWQPGTQLLVSFSGEDTQGQARVVYCKRLANKRFAVGLSLSAKARQFERLILSNRSRIV